ncbi:MAG: 2-dehydropantoate 2-reductase [Syntrophaceae bacterium]|nr:2-dehydropantoate 2-reductase [Syntrophaceae bacterium]
MGWDNPERATGNKKRERFKAMKIAVVGTGALGSLYAGYLARGGEEVYAIDIREDIVSAIRASGIRIVEPEGAEVSIRPKKATLNPEEVGVCDLVLLLPKSRQTEQAARRARCLFGPETAGLTVQNGLGNPETIEAVVGGGRILAGVTLNASTYLEPGRVRYAGRGETVIGEMRGGPSPRAEKIAATFNRAGLSAHVSEEVWNDVWGKLLVNAGVNPVTAITRLANGILADHEETREIVKGLVEEGERVARARGIRLPYPDAVKKVLDACVATAANYSSMLQDVLAQRETEVDFINGAIVREGEKLGIDTPVNRTLANLVRTIEKTYSLRASGLNK